MTTPITLIGAGLAGPLLAIYLAQRGFEVQLFERRKDLRKANISAGRSINLALAERGLYALREVGLAEQVAPLLIPMRGRMLHDESGTQQFQAYSQHPHEVIYSVSRAALNKLLLDAAEATSRVQICFEHTCQRVDFEQRQLHVYDEAQQQNRVFDFTQVIGTDGSGSVIREAILKHVKQPEFQEDFLPHGYKELQIPCNKNQPFQLEPHALHIWPRGGYMLIALPNTDGSFTVTLFLPHEGNPSFASLTSKEAVASWFNAQFPDAATLMPSLQQDFFEHPTGKLGTIHCAPWHYRDQALVLGDAAHAIVPFHGQGMNCAFEDCAILNQLLAHHSNDWESIFASFTTQRRPHTEAIAAMALENYIEMRDTVRDPKFQLKKQLAWELEARYPERFIPRYAMIMFRRTPYAEARRLGTLQDQLLNRMTQHAKSMRDVDWTDVEQQIRKIGL